MKTLTNRKGRVACWVACCLIFLAAAFTAESGYILLNDGTRIEGTFRVRRDGSVLVKSGASERTITADKIARVVGDKPAAWDQAEAKFRAGDFDAAIALFKQIETASRGQSWDQKALRFVGQAELNQGKGAQAVATYERLIKALNGRAGADIQLEYFAALLKTGAYEKLDGKLDVFVSKGSREQAAKAQIMRGDMKAAQKQWDNAVLDYMRTAILFESVQDVQPEALYKTAEAMAQLNDRRAPEFYKKVVEKYGSSEYAEMARKKL